MAQIVFAGIVPHSVALIPELSADADGGQATRAALQELGRRCAAARPDVLVLATPHGTRVVDAVCLAGTARAAGMVRWHGRTVEMNVPVDMALTDAIMAAARGRELPVALASFGGNPRLHSVIPLDWGTMVPLWFLGHARNVVGRGDALAPPPDDTGPPVVIVAPSQQVPRPTLVDFGRALAEAIIHDRRRVAVVASCDWAHAHRADGPYGFDPAAAIVDRTVVQALADNALERLIELDEEQIRAAAIDGLWQALILAGALEHTSMRCEVLSYEVASYFGMIVAAFTPTDA